MTAVPFIGEEVPPFTEPVRFGLTRTLAGRLFVGLLVSAILLGAATAAISYAQYRDLRAQVRAQLLAQAQAASLLIDREFESAIELAKFVATSGPLQDSDRVAFQSRMDAVQRWTSNPPGDNAESVIIALFDAAGQLQAISGLSLAPSQHHRADAPGTLRAIETGMPQILDLFSGSATGLRQIGVAVPVVLDDAPGKPILGTIAVTIPRYRLLAIAVQMIRQSDAVATVRDRNLVTVARSSHDAETLGTGAPAEPLLSALRQQPSGVVDGVGRFGGEPTVVAFAKAPNSGFSVEISLRERQLNAPLMASLHRTLLTTGLAAAAALAFCSWFGRSVMGAVQRAVQLAQAADSARDLPPTGLADADRLAALLVGAFRDRDRVATRALASERRELAITQAAPQIVWSANQDGMRDFCNRRWSELVGSDPSRSYGEGWLERVHPDERDQVAQRWMRSVRTGEPFEIEYRLRFADGTYRWMLGRAIAIHERGDDDAHWYGTCTEIEDIVQARLALARTQEDLEQLFAERTVRLRETEMRLAHAARLDAIGKLASGIAHDFNNVLQAAIANVQMMLSRAERPDQVRRYGATALNTIERGAAITGRLLTFSRQNTLQQTIFDAEAMLHSLHEMLDSILGHSIKLRLEIAPNLPRILADRHQLDTVLVNLVTNARDAIGGAGEIVLSARERESGEAGRHRRDVSIEVADNGPGMDAEILSRVREPFFTTKPPGQGTGLGLSMAQAFAEQSGGKLQVESAPGAGTTVRLLLRGVDADSLGPHSLLVVGANEGACRTMAATLRGLGHRVREGDPRDALAEASPLDAIFLAVPPAEPYRPPADRAREDLPAFIRAAWPDVPVLFVSDHNDDGTLEREHVLPSSAAPDAVAALLFQAVQAAREAAQLTAIVQKIRGRIDSPVLREGLDRWLSLRHGTSLPGQAGIAHLATFAEELTIIAEVDEITEPTRIHFQRVGAALEARGPVRLSGSDVPATGTEELGSVEAAYRQCARLMRPTYERLRVVLPGGEVDRFERLLLPFSDLSGRVQTILALITMDVTSDRKAASGP